MLYAFSKQTTHLQNSRVPPNPGRGLQSENNRPDKQRTELGRVWRDPLLHLKK